MPGRLDVVIAKALAAGDVSPFDAVKVIITRPAGWLADGFQEKTPVDGSRDAPDGGVEVRVNVSGSGGLFRSVE